MHCYWLIEGVDASTVGESCLRANRGAQVATVRSNPERDLVAGYLRAQSVTAPARLAYELNVALTSTDVRVRQATPALDVFTREPGLLFATETAAGAIGTSTCSGCYPSLAAGVTGVPTDDATWLDPQASGVSLDANGTFHVSTAGATTDALCEIVPAGDPPNACAAPGPDCPFDDAALRFAFPPSGARRSTDGRTYTYVPTAIAFDAAASRCASLPGGRLWVVHDEDERERVTRVLSDFADAPTTTSGGPVWVGLARAEGSSWAWVDGTSAASLPPAWAFDPALLPGSETASLDAGALVVTSVQSTYSLGLIFPTSRTLSASGFLCAQGGR